MCDSLAHGGPDGDGIYLDRSGKICLGHRRLAIRDLSTAGHQPMSKESEDVWLTFNGEIYNFMELREELEKNGYTFETATDTEVVLKAYILWGTAAFGKLEGMFAFAVVDLRSNKTYLVRGQAGIKPLYYRIHDNGLIFASEVRAFRNCGLHIPEDPDWKILFLAFGHIPEPFTTLEGVRMLPKGHFLEWDNETGEHELREYFTYQYSPEIKDHRSAVGMVQETLQASVDRHLIADAPIGVFLSGRIDSSILTLLAGRSLGTELKTLSLNFAEAGFNERPYQQVIAEKVNGNHTENEISKADFAESFGAIMEAMDQPSTDGINTWFISRCAKENGLKTVLSGIGGDEYFGGYPSFNRVRLISGLRKLPRILLRLAEMHSVLKYKRISYLSMKNPIGEYLFMRGCYTPGTIARILGLSRERVLGVLERFPTPPALNDLKGGNRISWFESNLYMQNQLLKDTDTMSMCHGIEIRVPFLDHQMIRTMLKIDPAVKFNNKLPKKLLIEAFADILPKVIWNRSKMGFTVPLQEWMKEAGVISNENLYPGSTSKKLIKAFKKGKLHWSAAFALYLVHNSAATPVQETEQRIVRNQSLKDLFWEPFQMIKTRRSFNYSLN